MGYKKKPYFGISKKARPRFEKLGGIGWLYECHHRYQNGETIAGIAKNFDLPDSYIFDRFLDYQLLTKRQSRTIGINDQDNPRLYDWLYTKNFKPNLEGEDAGKWEL